MHFSNGNALLAVIEESKITALNCSKKYITQKECSYLSLSKCDLKWKSSMNGEIFSLEVNVTESAVEAVKRI